jgi:predicted nucleotidyltransferase
MLTSKEIFETLKKNHVLLEKYTVKKIGLFGSFVRNEATEKSDIDLLVDFKEKTFNNYIEFTFELEKIFNRKVDLLTEKGISSYILPYINDEVKWYEAE